MKILFVGDLNKHARSFQRFRALTDLGHEVDGLSFVPLGKCPGIDDKISIPDSIMTRIGFPLDHMKINKKLKHITKTRFFDLLWIEMPTTLRPTPLQSLKQNNPRAKTIFYSTDNIQKKHNQSYYTIKILKHMDVVYTVRGYSKEFYYKHGARRVEYFDRSYDRNYLYPRHAEAPYDFDVVFIGTYEKDRFHYLRTIAQTGLSVDIWGNRWPNVRIKNLRIHHSPLYGDEFIEAMHKSKIVLNFLRKINADTSTGRTFEIPGSGSFMLSERSDIQLEYFKEGLEAEFFSSESELIEKLRYYLSHPEDRSRIAQKGRERCETSGYSHHERLQNILNQIEETE